MPIEIAKLLMYTYFVKTKTPRIAIYSNKALVETQQEKSRHATHTTISPLIDEDIKMYITRTREKIHLKHMMNYNDL